MATDLDHDDALGRHLRELRAPETAAPTDRAWAGVEQHRRTRRTRHLIATLGTTVVVLVIAVAAFATAQSDNGSRHVEVVTPSTVAPPADPPIFDVLPVAKTAQLRVTRAGTIPAGSEIGVELTQSPHKVGDTINTNARVCFPWADGETCDPSVDVRYVEDTGGVTTYRLTMPGWVRTAAGPRSCEEIGCRIAMQADDGTRIGTPVLDIESGTAPVEAASLVSAGADGVVRIVMDGLDADESWKRYAAAVDQESLDAGWTGICALGASLECDSIVRAPQPTLDGQRHAVDIETNRLLHTPEGWIDCVEVTCAIVISLTVGVTWNSQSSGSYAEIATIVPYRLPPDTPPMTPPTMTVTPTENLHNKDVVTVTIRDLPGNVDPIKWRELGGIGQCSAEDLRLVRDCTFATQKTFTELPGNGLRVEYPVRTCYNGPKCYLTLQAGGNGYPELARTEPFEVLP
jgi:hypothetical protein